MLVSSRVGKSFPVASLVKVWTAGWVLVLGVAGSLSAQVSNLPRLDQLEQAQSKLLRRTLPLEPQESQKALVVAPGFEVQLVAAEPLVYDPVDLTFDEQGRLWVCEMRSWPLRQKERLCRIRVLEDRDGDGRMDCSWVFADKLAFPVSVCRYKRGVFVAASPHIWYMEDTNGDGRADLRRKALTGFRVLYSTHPVGCLRWGLDGRIYGVARSGGQVQALMWPSRPGAKHQIHLPMYHHFSFDPRTGDLRVESGGGQFGLSMDSWGHWFTCANNNSPLLQIAYPLRMVRRNPYVDFPRPAVPIFDPQRGMEIFRQSPPEGWRVLRQLRRVRDNLPGAEEAGGRPWGTFTAASGATIYTGDQYPGFGLTALIGDTTSNLIHRKSLFQQGVLYRAKRVDRQGEWLASRENWFRPVMMTNSPWGVIYVADMYREILEYIGSIPPEALRVIDLNSGWDRGRLWRIVPRGFRQPSGRVPLGNKTSAQLVRLLEHPNGWHRLTAHRLLVQRDEPQMVPLLEQMVCQGSPLGRMMALWVLQATGRLRPAVLVQALQDAHWRVCAQAVQVAYEHMGHPQVAQAVLALAHHPQVEVRYWVAFALGELNSPAATAALVQIARQDVADPWVRVAVLSSSVARAGEMMRQLCAVPSWLEAPQCKEWLRPLAQTAAATASPEQLSELVELIQRVSRSRPHLGLALAQGVVEGVRRTRPERLRLQGNTDPESQALAQLMAQGAQVALDPQAPWPLRVQAVELVGQSPWSQAAPVLQKLLDAHAFPQLQQAALMALGRFARKEVSQWILQRFGHFSPAVKRAALDTLLSRPIHVEALLQGLEQGRLRPGELTSLQVRRLLRYPRPELRQRAQKLLQAPSPRQEVIAQYQKALRLQGDPRRGQVVFRRHCAACHHFRGEGHRLAPPLEGVLARGPQALLIDILDPNRQVDPEFVNYLVLLQDGRTTSGIIVQETPLSITLRRGEGQQEQILRSQIEAIQSTGMSLMPEGLEKQISVEQMADLLAFLFGQQ